MGVALVLDDLPRLALLGGRHVSDLLTDRAELDAEIADGKAKVQRQTEAGYDEVEAPLPAVVSVTAGVVEPRYPSFKGIMAAKGKPVEELKVGDLGIEAGSVGQEITDVTAAEERKAGEIIQDEGDAHEKIVAFLEQLKVI